MAYWNHQTPYVVNKPVFKSHKMHSTVSVRVSRDDISRDATGKYSIPPGVFLARVNGVDRPLARDYTTAAATTAQTFLAVSHPELFKAGDLVYHQESTNTITIGGTWVAGDTLTVQINTNFITFTVTQTTAAGVAAEFTTYLNESLFAQQQILRATVSGAVISLFTSGAATLVVSETSTAGTIAAGAGSFVTTYPLIGTIASVDSDASRLVFTSTLAINVPVGAAVGVRPEYVYGLTSQPISLDDGRLVQNIGVYNEADVYHVGLVYWDNLLKEQFPQLTVYYQT